jgi:thiamine biosynthesis lipoprotein
VVGIALSLLTAAAHPELHRYESVEPHMGTLVRVTVYTPDGEAATRAFRAAFGRIAFLDRVLSDYKPDSELNVAARSAVGRDVPISGDLFTVLEAAQHLAYATGGAFDVTQGPVIRLWREARKTGRLPAPAAVREAGESSGFRKLHLNPEKRTIRLDAPGMALDVGANGKGYAASEALEAIGKLGVRSALVAISGDLAFSGAPPGQRGWRIGLHSADPSAIGIPATLELTDAAVSASGNAEQHVDVDGRRYSHVIDPSTGVGLVEDITVTVVARHGLEADGLDTAVSVLGVERGLALIESRPGAAALIVQRKDGKIRAHASRRLEALLKPRTAE